MEAEENYFLKNTSSVISKYQVSELGLLAAKIAYHNFQWRFVTLVLVNTVNAIGLLDFLRNYDNSVIIKLGWVAPDHPNAVPQIVVFGDNASDISNMIRWLVKLRYDSNAKYIIICGSYKQECGENIIFDTLLKFFVLNVIVLKSNKDNEPQAFCYQIVTPNKCLNGIPVKIDLISNCPNEKCFKTLFPERLTNFYKCPLVISTVEQAPFMYLHNGTKKPSGTDGDVVQLAAEMLNATLVLKTPNDDAGMGYYTDEGWTGCLGDIHRGRAEASMSSSPLTANIYGNFQISDAYYSMDMVWVAKQPKKISAWEQLVRPLKYKIRIILLCLFGCIVFLNTLKDTKTFHKVIRSFQIEPPKYNLLFLSWILCLGFPILKIPTKNSLRIAVFTWIWCCFLIRCAYQSALIYAMKHTAHNDVIHNFSDIQTRRLTFGGLPSFRDYYIEERDIYDNWVELQFENYHKLLHQILDGTTDFVLASNKEIVKYHLQIYNGTKIVQIIPKKIVNSPTVVYFKKYSPITAPLNHVLHVAFEAGFVQRFYSRYINVGDINYLLQQYKLPKFEALNIQHFAGCFLCILVGWFVSIIFFVVEIVCGNLNDNASRGSGISRE